MFQFRFFTKKNLYYLKKLRDQLRRSNIGFFALIIPFLISFASNLFEGFTFVLFVPAFDWITKKDLSSIKGHNFFDVITGYKQLEFLKVDNNLFIAVIVGMFLSSVAKNILSFISYRGTSKQVRKISGFLRKKIYERYLSFGKLYFEKHSQGYLHQLLTTYVDTVASEFKNLYNAADAGFRLFIYFCVMLYISVKLTVIVLLVFPVLHNSTTGIIRKIKKSSKDYAESYNMFGRRITNSLGCIPLIKAYATERKEVEDFNRTSDNLRDLQYSVDKQLGIIPPLQEIIMLCLMFILLGIISYIASSEGANGVGKYISFILILRRSSPLFSFINSARTSLAGLGGPLQEVMSVFDNEMKYAVTSGNKEVKNFEGQIELKNLNFSYPGGTQILNGVDFTIKKGEMTAIVGQSGSGKSTIINLLMRYYDSAPGTIFIDGTDIRDLRIESWLDNVGLVSQEAFLFHATFRENLTYGLKREVSDEELLDAVKKSKLQDLLSKMPNGLDSEIGDKGMKLSGGEKQRISIARAILKRPEILILDEPTSALDSNTEKQIQAVIDEMFGDKTIIVIAHRLATVQHAEKVVVLEKGKVVEKGPPRQLLAQRGKFHAYWEAQHLTNVMSQI